MKAVSQEYHFSRIDMAHPEALKGLINHLEI